MKLLATIHLSCSSIAGAYSSTTTMSEKWGTILTHVVGIAVGSPATGVQRNQFIDFSGHAGLVGNGVYNSNYHFGHAVQEWFSSLGYMIKHGLKGKKQREAVDKILNIMGYSNSFDLFTYSNLGLTENITERSTLNFLKNRNLLSKSAEKIQDLTSQLYRLSGNDTLIDSRRAKTIVSFQQFWTRNFDNFDTFEEWLSVVGRENGEQLNQFINLNNLTKNEWEFLKRAKRVNIKADLRDGVLPFDDIPDFITRQTIFDTDDDIARMFKSQNETVSQFKARVGQMWQKIVYNMMQDRVPTPTYTDSVTRRLVPESPILHIVLRGALKYVDPAVTQFINARNRIARATYGDTSQYTGFDKSLILYGMGFFKYLAGATALRFIKDINSNRQPTNFRDPKNMLQLMSATGYFGYTNTLLTQLLNVYGDTGTGIITGTPLGGTQDRFGRILKKAFQSQNETRAFDVARGVAQISGYSQLWAAKGVMEYLLRKILLTPYQEEQYIHNMQEYGKKPIIK